MRVSEAAKILGKSESMVREYARTSGLQRVGGAYDITQDTLEDWVSSPPSVRKSRTRKRPSIRSKLGGPPILDSLRGLETPSEKARRMRARKGRKERLIAAIRGNLERSV